MITPVSVGLVAAFAVLAGGNWSAVVAAEPDRRQVAITKTGATAVLVALAALVGEMDGAARVVLVAAVVLCLAGDVALLGDTDARFLAGLGSFALGHGAYVACAVLVGVDWPRLAWAFPFLAMMFGFRFITRTIPGARRHGGAAMAGAVVVYAVVIAAMVVTATGTPAVAAAVGAMLFAVSDWMIGHDRFVAPLPRARLAVMSTYHVGQLLLIIGLIAGG